MMRLFDRRRGPAPVIALCLLVAGCGLFGGSKKQDNPDGGAGDVCTLNDQCTSGFVCAGGHCALPGSVGVGGSCSATRDCGTGLYCSEVGVCGPVGGGQVGDACSTGADCEKGLDCVLTGFSGSCEAAGTGDLGASCQQSTDCIAGLVCGTDGLCDPVITAYPPFEGVSCGADENPFRVYWQVPRPTARLADFYRLPFPNDARINDDGTLDLSDFPRPGKSLLGVDIVDLYATALSEDFDGFSTVAPVTFRFSSELDFASLGTNGANIHYVDITDPQDSGFGADRGRNFSYDTGQHKFVCQNALVVGNSPNDPLEPGHTYAVYMTTAIQSSGGEAPAIDPDLAAVLGGTQPTDPILAKVWTRYGNFRTYLTTNSIAPTSIAGAAVLTAADAPARAEKLAAAVTGGALPQLTDLTLCDGQTTSPCDGDGDRHCGDSSGSFWEIQGRFTEPNFQAGTLPYETPADGGAIQWDGSGDPVAQGTSAVCFALTIPKTTMPSGGWPLVIHAHGTGGSFEDGINSGIAGALATTSTPMATLTYDGIGHGERRGSSTRSPDSLVFNVINPRAARDNHRQGAVDVIQALRIAQVAPFAVTGITGSISFDAARTYFFGHSQGSNVGIPGVAVSPDAQAAIFSGAGSNLTKGILTKTSPVNAKAGLELLLGDSLGGGEPVMVLWQTFFDGIDPLNFDRLLVTAPPPGVPSKHVFMTWSATDTFAPKDTLTATAQVMGLLQAEPVIESIAPVDSRPVTNDRTGGDGVARTAAVFQYDTDGSYDGHFVSTQNPAAVADWKAFLTSLAAGGVPNVP
jgi:fermentation-respiration switch protein FrsA (DUF1100 family)